MASEKEFECFPPSLNFKNSLSRIVLTLLWTFDNLLWRHLVLGFCLLEDFFITVSISAFVTQFSLVQSLSHIWLFATPWTAACQASLSITNSRGLLKLMSIGLVMPSNHLILCYPLLLPSIFPSIRVFSHESVLHIKGPKDWSFSFSISPSNEYSGLISFRMDWLGLLAVQGTLKSLLQYHSSKALIIRCSAFFIVQLSHAYMTTGETIALTRRTFVGRVMSLPIRTRPNFPLSQSLPSGSFHKPNKRNMLTSLGHKESWAPKNWWFWTVVLEKTLESPLDCKETQPVHPKGGQPLILTGRTDAKSWSSSNTLATWCKELTH